MNKHRFAKIASLSLSAVALVSAATLTSCSNSSHLLLYQQSNLGLNAGINPSTQNLHVRIGLRRQFGAIIPKYTTGETNPDGTQTNKAASAYFGSRARITGPFRVPEVAEVMATGAAAVIAAKSGKALDFTNQDTSPLPSAVTSPVDPPLPSEPSTPPDDDVSDGLE